MVATKFTSPRTCAFVYPCIFTTHVYTFFSTLLEVKYRFGLRKPERKRFVCLPDEPLPSEQIPSLADSTPAKRSDDFGLSRNKCFCFWVCAYIWVSVLLTLINVTTIFNFSFTSVCTKCCSPFIRTYKKIDNVGQNWLMFNISIAAVLFIWSFYISIGMSFNVDWKIYYSCIQFLISRRREEHWKRLGKVPEDLMTWEHVLHQYIFLFEICLQQVSPQIFQLHISVGGFGPIYEKKFKVDTDLRFPYSMIRKHSQSDILIKLSCMPFVSWLFMQQNYVQFDCDTQKHRKPTTSTGANY